MSCTEVHLRSRSLNIVSLSDMIEGSYRSWDLYTTGQLVDGLQQKRKLVFIKWKWNHVVFSRAIILSFHPVCVCVYIYIYIYTHTHTHTKMKNHKVFSGWFYLLNYLPTLSILVFRLSLRHVSYQWNKRWKSFKTFYFHWPCSVWNLHDVVSFSFSEKLKLQFVCGQQNAADYVKILNDLSLAQEGHRLCGVEWIFQQCINNKEVFALTKNKTSQSYRKFVGIDCCKSLRRRLTVISNFWTQKRNLRYKGTSETNTSLNKFQA